MYHARRTLPAFALFGLAAGSAVVAGPWVVRAAESQATPGTVSSVTSQAAVDAEVVANLILGGVFAGAAHLEERLEGLGGRVTSFEVRELAGWVGVSVLPVDPTEDQAIRVYGRAGPAPSLVWSHRARGALRVEPVPHGGEPRLLVLVWEDREAPLGARDVTAMVLALAPRPVVIWRSADGAAVGGAQEVVRRGNELRVRRIVSYPGAGAGCERSTGRVEIYRLDAAGGRVALMRVDAVEPWHRELREAALRVFALSAGDGGRRDGGIALPPGLESAPVCDHAEGNPPRRAHVGATDAAGRAWWLDFARSASGWRLIGVRPVLN